MVRKVVYCFIITLLLCTSVLADVDTTKIGVEQGYLFTFQVTDLINEFNDNFKDREPETCVKCDEEPIYATKGDEWTIEVLNLNSTHVNASFQLNQLEETVSMPFGDRRNTLVLYTDWEYWPQVFAEDWAWVLEAENDPVAYFGVESNIIDFDGNLVHQVDGDVFKTVLYWKRYWNENEALKTLESNQTIHYDLQTGVRSFFFLNRTRIYWDGAVERLLDVNVMTDFINPSITSSTDGLSNQTTTSSDDELNFFYLGGTAMILGVAIYSSIFYYKKK